MRLLQALCGQAEQLWGGAHVPVRVVDLDMAEGGRELGQVTVDVDVLPIPAYQCLDGKAVATVVQAWPMAVGWPPSADLA